MKAVTWIADKVVSRIATIIGGLIVSKVESDALNAHVDLLEVIETRAQQLEMDGKTELATRLRKQADDLAIDKPGQNSLLIASHFGDFDELDESPSKGGGNRITSDSDRSTKVGKPKRGRGRPPKTTNDDESI